MGEIIDFVGGGTFVVFLAIIIIVLLVAYLSSRYKVAGANEALIRSGRATPLGGGDAGLKVVRGQGIVVLPLFHKIGKLKLTARQINVSLADAVSRQGIKVAVQGVATFKIGADDESIRNAAERFLDAQEEEVDSIVKNVLEGSLRSIVGTLTIEELNLDRMKFQQAVQDAAKGDLATSGLQIDSFTIQAIRDESGYMDLIGQQETARRERDARMAKAGADQEAAVREAEANQIKINADRDVSIRRAETEMQIAAAEARAAQAGPLAQAEAQQEVTRKQTELAQLEADRKQKELIASTIRPAEADAEAQIRRAEGEKGARIAQAQAEAERVKLAGQAEATVARDEGRGERQGHPGQRPVRGREDEARGQRRGRHHLHQGRGGGQGARAPRPGLSPVQRGGRHPDRPLDAAGDRPGGRRADGEHQGPDRALDRWRVGARQERHADRRGGIGRGQGRHRHRHPEPDRLGDGRQGRRRRRRRGRRLRRRRRPGRWRRPGSNPATDSRRDRRPRRSRPGASATTRGIVGELPRRRPSPPGARSRPPRPPRRRRCREGTDVRRGRRRRRRPPPVPSRTRRGRRTAATMEQAQAAMSRADQAMRRAREATATAFGGQAEDVQPITTDTTINVAAQRLARDLQAIPGIERFGALRLAELDRSGRGRSGRCGGSPAISSASGTAR